MIEKDSKTETQEKFKEQHTLTPAQFKRLVAEKIERAKFYSFSYKERERRAELD